MSKPWWAGRQWAMERGALAYYLDLEVEVERDEGLPYRLEGQTAVIDVCGPLTARPSFWGGVSYEEIRAALVAAEADPQVADIRLEVNSPGGEVQGVRVARAQLARCAKPTEARAVGHCLSAAYWLSTAADRVTALAEAPIGSVGVLIGVLLDDDDRRRVFVSSATRRKAARADTEDGAAQTQALVDEMAGIMLGDIATARGWAPDGAAVAVGEGATFLASEALARGMVDAILTPEEVVGGVDEVPSVPAPLEISSTGNADVSYGAEAGQFNATGVEVVTMTPEQQAEMDRLRAAAAEAEARASEAEARATATAATLTELSGAVEALKAEAQAKACNEWLDRHQARGAISAAMRAEAGEAFGNAAARKLVEGLPDGAAVPRGLQGAATPPESSQHADMAALTGHLHALAKENGTSFSVELQQFKATQPAEWVRLCSEATMPGRRGAR